MTIERRKRGGPACVFGIVAAVVCVLVTLAPEALAQTASDTPSPISARKIFTMLFLMLGPIKILVPFVTMTRGADAAFRRSLATRAVLFSAAALAVAGLLGRGMLENFNISLPVLALTGGLVLFLVALQTVLQQATGPARPKPDDPPPGLHLAFSPLAFPTVVTPYGIAAVIVFAALAQNNYIDKLVVAGVVLLILALDWLAMLFAEAILKRVGTTLQVFAVVLGVTQIALGLQVILHSLSMIGVFVERVN
ncbi:MAG TPA: MarC family protein [Dongiaceae bacterium]|jgi:multiple antibiotic resistance protein